MIQPSAGLRPAARRPFFTITPARLRSFEPQRHRVHREKKKERISVLSSVFSASLGVDTKRVRPDTRMPGMGALSIPTDPGAAVLGRPDLGKRMGRVYVHGRRRVPNRSAFRPPPRHPRFFADMPGRFSGRGNGPFCVRPFQQPLTGISDVEPRRRPGTTHRFAGLLLCTHFRSFQERWGPCSRIDR